MDIQIIKKPFMQIGADVIATGIEKPRWSNSPGLAYKIDVREGVFQIATDGKVDVSVVDVKVHEKHLLLNVTEVNEKRLKQKHKFLLGFDERDWFVAAIPEKYTWVKNVTDAKQVLKPEPVMNAERGLTRSAKNVRRNKAWVRQGEWFFVPEYSLQVNLKMVHENEPISRGNGSKPHMVDEVYRMKGEVVYVSQKYPAGISETRYRNLVAQKPGRKAEFRMMMRNSEVFAKGRVKHADHATIFLDGWHRVMMNTEAQALIRTNLAFLD